MILLRPVLICCIQLGKKNFALQSSLSSTQSPPESMCVTSDSAAGYSSIDRSYEFTTTLDDDALNLQSELISERRRPKKGKGKSSRRVRQADISDQTSTGEPSSDAESLSQSRVAHTHTYIYIYTT